MSGIPIPIPSYKKINEGILSSSYDESFDVITKFRMHKRESKRVKILKCPEEKSGQTFEDIINEFILENVHRYELIDIKYTDKSCLIIYKII